MKLLFENWRKYLKEVNANDVSLRREAEADGFKDHKDGGDRGDRWETLEGGKYLQYWQLGYDNAAEVEEMDRHYAGAIGETENPELSQDSEAFETFKKALPLHFRVADDEETIQTKEGPVNARAGDYIMTGTESENWPIPAAKFEETYDILSTYDKNPVKGEAAKKKILVFAKQMSEPFQVKVSWSSDLLSGDVDDYLVQYGPGDYGVVGREIFEKTYESNLTN